MKDQDITQQVLAIYEEKQMTKWLEETKEECKNGLPQTLKNELELLLNKANVGVSEPSNNVIDFVARRSYKLAGNLGSTELLAASGQSLGEWFSQPMNFGGAGFILDIRRVIGSEQEVDIYLSPNTEDKTIMERALEVYIGKTVEIVISNNGEPLLEACLYVDETGSEAEGSGLLLKTSEDGAIKGNLSIDVVVKD